MTSTINSSNLYQKAAYAVNFARQREQLRQELQDSLPSLKIGQIVYCWRDELDDDGRSFCFSNPSQARSLFRKGNLPFDSFVQWSSP